MITDNPAAGDVGHRRGKRLFDLLVAIGLTPVAIPVCLIAAIPILFETHASPFFRQVRVGQNGVPFSILKLRTMSPGTREGASHEVGVATLLKSGRIYRRLKIDELPQLWNVLNGTMSLVGPRPHLPSQVVLTEERLRRGVLAMKPGITGVSQVAGLDMSDPHRLAKADAAYLGAWSLGKDIEILWQTVAGRGNGDAASKGTGG